MLYLTNRAIGQSAMTREYVFSLKEAGVKMPRGPLLLQVDSLVGALQTEVREEWNLQNKHCEGSCELLRFLNTQSEESVPDIAIRNT